MKNGVIVLDIPFQCPVGVILSTSVTFTPCWCTSCVLNSPLMIFRMVLKPNPAFVRWWGHVPPLTWLLLPNHRRSSALCLVHAVWIGPSASGEAISSWVVPHKSRPFTKQHLFHWLAEVIAYLNQHLQPPVGLRAHSTQR